ncbi:hypothetical protein DM860_005600 [Cuscuta australis]|uniref:RING-type E3 ubiquitin transferase n=1 Tax=Cuscuta australis TaxID=267555 RepID=A0A328DRZ7_9ASTE|nr:hypothetical protein DM860_005600 [Cuscuta australis]
MMMMTGQKNGGVKKDIESVVVAIDKDKGSQYALKWAIDKFSLGKGKSVTLLHVNHKPSSQDSSDGHRFQSVDSQTSKELFLPFRCFCNRKNINVNEVVIEGADISKALCDYVHANAIDNIVLGAPSKNSFVRFKTPDIPSSVSKNAPEFCNIYVVAKGKVSSSRAATISTPTVSARSTTSSGFSDPRLMHSNESLGNASDRSSPFSHRSTEDNDFIKSPFSRGGYSNRSYGELSVPDSIDISFVSSGRQSTERAFPMFMDSPEPGSYLQRLSNGSDSDNRLSFGSAFSGSRLSDMNNNPSTILSSLSQESGGSWSSSSQSMVILSNL